MDVTFPANIAEQLGISNPNPDFLPTLYYMLYSYEPRHADVMIYKYKDGMTMKQIGKKLNVSRQRIGDMIKRTLEVLKKPDNMEILRQGIKEHYAGITDSEIEHVKQIFMDARNNELGKQEGMPPDLRTPISRLHISIRAFNAMDNAGLKTIKDILDKGPYHVRTARGVGEKVFNEITDILVNRFGQDRQEWTVTRSGKAGKASTT